MIFLPQHRQDVRCAFCLCSWTGPFSLRLQPKFKLPLFVKFSASGSSPGCMSGCSPTFLPALHLCTQTPPPPPPIIPCHHLSSHHTPPPLQAAAAEQEEALRLSGAGWACC